MRVVFSPGTRGIGASVSLLVARIFFGGGMLMSHGWSKMQNLLAKKYEEFPEVLGLPKAVGMSLATVAEFVAAGLLVLGLLTRPAAVGLVALMGVAAFVIHDDAIKFVQPGGGSSAEMAILYLGGFLTILLAGPGLFSLDSVLTQKNKE